MQEVSIDTLIKHVFESNKIDSIIARKGEPGFDDHLTAAKLVAASHRTVIHPHMIRYVVRSIAGAYLAAHVDPGKFRKIDATIGGQPMTHWKDVPDLMSVWDHRTQLFFSRVTTGFAGRSDEVENTIWNFHDEFVTIHPFIGLNGIVARLWLNSARLYAGLPWHIVPSEKREKHFAHIVEFAAHRKAA